MNDCSAMWRVLTLLAVFGISACGGDDPPLLQSNNSESDSGTQTTGPDDGSTGITNNVVFPGEDMGPQEEMGECSPDQLDEPDPSFFDANCDGIDGDESQSVFVATYGDDANPGTKSLPKASVGAAIEEAAATGKTWVLVEESLYDGGFELVDGVNLAGGYGFGWRRDGRAKTTIRGGNPSIRATNISSRTLVMDLTVEGGTGEPGQTAVGILVEGSTGLVLQNLRVTGGRGGAGASGDTGARGTTGNRGSNGENAPPDSGTLGCRNQDSSDAPSVGPGAEPACGSDVGRGGAGGRSGKGSSSGQSGQRAPDSGGEGGNGGGQSTAGFKGQDGPSGSSGAPGAGGGSGGQFDGWQWLGESGQAGEDGTPGKGGGGGGGGGGGKEFGFWTCDSWGGAGGGGGSGGCGGAGGEGGGHGGASVAVMLLESDITIRNCQIYGGAGGAGGSGGGGGQGGTGGDGGTGGNSEENSGKGGAGGRGGTGGRGGEGGGGAGGPSIGLFSNRALSVQPINTMVTQGEAGVGGSAASADGRGADGFAESVRIAQ